MRFHLIVLSACFVAACSDTSNSESVLETVMEDVVDTNSSEPDFWFVGPPYEDLYFEDGRIKPSEFVTFDNKIRHPFGSCDSGPVNIKAGLDHLTPRQLACRVGRITYGSEVEPLTSEKDRAVARIPGFLRKLDGMYQFEHRCDGSSLGTGSASATFDVPTLKQHAKMLKDCTFAEHIEKNGRPVTMDDLRGR